MLVISALGKDFVNLYLAFMDLLLKKVKSINISVTPSLIRTDAGAQLTQLKSRTGYGRFLQQLPELSLSQLVAESVLAKSSKNIALVIEITDKGTSFYTV